MSSRPPASVRQDFEALYERHHREVWAVAYARRLNSDTALDVTQEAFLRLWKEWQRGATIVHPRAWLLRVARNLAEDHAKSAFTRNGTLPPQSLNGLRSNAPAPTERLERLETLAELRIALAALSEADREILTLRYALDYETEAIADVLGVNATAVHMRLSRARQRVAERLASNGAPHKHDRTSR